MHCTVPLTLMLIATFKAILATITSQGFDGKKKILNKIYKPQQDFKPLGYHWVLQYSDFALCHTTVVAVV